eukprot:CAMPEP_0174734958 /NCGR_PEP_ID=MMETSP1094-20130205/64147_1 /TAXON_ID=156173 /ORGANISM="Chrysochromulina brevifilum, Strain UTEX LB 985" /LENGTH=52 /DNA_ID=CAMNT_0015937859 /DNA_START=110 /DNA_END=265 /DNA_ORIENTATION=+
MTGTQRTTGSQKCKAPQRNAYEHQYLSGAAMTRGSSADGTSELRCETLLQSR